MNYSAKSICRTMWCLITVFYFISIASEMQGTSSVHFNFVKLAVALYSLCALFLFSAFKHTLFRTGAGRNKYI